MQGIELLFSNPFGQFNEMKLFQDKWIKIDKQKAIVFFAGRKETFISFRNSETLLEGYLMRSDYHNKIGIETPTEKYLPVIDEKQVLAYFKKVSDFFPNHKTSSVGCDILISSEIYDEQDIPSATPCFSAHLGWAYIISPVSYEEYFSKEDLLSIPNVYPVEELPNGQLLIVLYKHPYDYDVPENIQKIKDVTQYLRSKEKKRT